MLFIKDCTLLVFFYPDIPREVDNAKEVYLFIPVESFHYLLWKILIRDSYCDITKGGVCLESIEWSKVLCVNR